MTAPAKRVMPSVVTGVLLIGGASRRMGRPKHLLPLGGVTWGGRIAGVLATVCGRVVLAGSGETPVPGMERIDDAPGVRGPLAGILAAARAFPDDALLVCACDLPFVSGAALRWLIDAPRPGDRAVIPRAAGHDQPLLALYLPAVFPAIEALARRPSYRMTSVCRLPGVRRPEVPSGLRRAWDNLNSPQCLRAAGLPEPPPAKAKE